MIGIYGAGGFIGRHMVRRLAGRGLPVRAVSRRFDSDFRASWETRADMVEADFSHSMSMLSTLDGVDTVIQLISSSSPGMGNRLLVEDIKENVIPHISFIQNAIDRGVKKYVFVSSGGTVYGPDAPVPTPETAHTNPINSHGMTKLTIEKYLQMFGRVDGLNYVILRVSNPYGPGQMFRKGQGLIPAVVQRHRDGKPIQIIGDGTAERDYLYIDDLAAAIEKVIENDAIQNEIFNIGSGRGASVLDVIAALEEVMGEPFTREFLPARATDVPKSILDISKARAALDWSPKTTLHDGLRAFYDSLR